MKKRSEKLIKELKTIRYFQNGLRKASWKLQDRLREENAGDEIIELGRSATSSLCEAETSFDEIFSKQIGKAIVNEL